MRGTAQRMTLEARRIRWWSRSRVVRDLSVLTRAEDLSRLARDVTAGLVWAPIPRRSIVFRNDSSWVAGQQWAFREQSRVRCAVSWAHTGCWRRGRCWVAVDEERDNEAVAWRERRPDEAGAELEKRERGKGFGGKSNKSECEAGNGR